MDVRAIVIASNQKGECKYCEADGNIVRRMALMEGICFPARSRIMNNTLENPPREPVRILTGKRTLIEDQSVCLATTVVQLCYGEGKEVS